MARAVKEAGSGVESKDGDKNKSVLTKDQEELVFSYWEIESKIQSFGETLETSSQRAEYDSLRKEQKELWLKLLESGGHVPFRSDPIDCAIRKKLL